MGRNIEILYTAYIYSFDLLRVTCMHVNKQTYSQSQTGWKGAALRTAKRIYKHVIPPDRHHKLCTLHILGEHVDNTIHCCNTVLRNRLTSIKQDIYSCNWYIYITTLCNSPLLSFGRYLIWSVCSDFPVWKPHTEQQWICPYVMFTLSQYVSHIMKANIMHDIVPTI